MKENSCFLVRASLFVYDCSRFLFLLLVFLALNPGGSGPFQNPAGVFPHVMYAAPNALFPLMSFFLLIRFGLSRAYIPLYATGKALCVLCLFIWLILAIRWFRQIPRLLVWPFFIGAADLGSVMGAFLLHGSAAGEGGGILPDPVETARGGE
ncbi:MAG: hypothetical protein LBD31_01685 [Treponema sp.]|nr:hypothetical protein [Treponema sp.]